MILEILKVLSIISTITTATFSPFLNIQEERTISKEIEAKEIEVKILQKVQEKYPSCFLPSPSHQTCPFVSPFLS